MIEQLNPIASPKSTLGQDYARYFQLLEFMLVQSDDLAYNPNSTEARKRRMADHKKRLEWMKRDLLTDPGLHPDTRDSILTMLDHDTVRDMMVEFDSILERKLNGL